MISIHGTFSSYAAHHVPSCNLLGYLKQVGFVQRCTDLHGLLMLGEIPGFRIQQG